MKKRVEIKVSGTVANFCNKCKKRTNILIKIDITKKKETLKAHFMLCKAILCKVESQINTKPVKKWWRKKHKYSSKEVE